MLVFVSSLALTHFDCTQLECVVISLMPLIMNKKEYIRTLKS